jgi:putative hydrolase of the HAD superfamily
MSFKTVTVDFWDTIAYYTFNDEIFKERVDHSFEIYKYYDISYDTAFMLMRSVYEHFENLWHKEFRTPTTPEMFRHIEKLISFELEKDHFEELVRYNETLVPEKYFQVKPEISRALRILSEKYDLVIISDTGFEPGREIRKALERQGLLNCFKYGVFSDETGFSKPDKRAFEKAAEVTGSKFDQMIHIGDREAKDIEGARSAGMKSILYTGFRDDDMNGTKADYTASDWNKILNIL